VVGDAANTAARLCGIANPFQALLTQSVVADISTVCQQRSCSFLRSQMFKGKSRAVDIYQLRTEGLYPPD